MDQTHIHLLITHLPIIASILGGIVLVYGLLTKSNQTKIAAYILFILSSIGAGIAYLTGGEAEETVEDINGISENIIERHEDFALIALISLIILGVISITGIFFTLKNSSLKRPVALVILFVSLISFGLVSRTGYLGGKIRHTEINTNPGSQEQGEENEKD